MADRAQIAEVWTSGISQPDDAHRDAVAAVLADDVTTVNPMGSVQGKDAVLAAYGRSALAPAFAQGTWSTPAVSGDTVTSTCTFPAGSPVATATVNITVDDSGLIRRVETALATASGAKPSKWKLLLGSLAARRRKARG